MFFHFAGSRNASIFLQELPDLEVDPVDPISSNEKKSARCAFHHRNTETRVYLTTYIHNIFPTKRQDFQDDVPFPKVRYCLVSR